MLSEFVKFLSRFVIRLSNCNARKGMAGGIDANTEPAMPNYEINYLHDDGSLACKFEAQCEDDTHAKVLAHAMKDHDHKGLEVWNGTSLVYQRPQPRG
jgi:hypothetical protein